jgi:hypothetical protein
VCSVVNVFFAFAPSGIIVFMYLLLTIIRTILYV